MKGEGKDTAEVEELWTKLSSSRERIGILAGAQHAEPGNCRWETVSMTLRAPWHYGCK